MDIFVLKNGANSFSCHVDEFEFERIKRELLGRKIHVTNRHEWSSQEIILAYRGQFNVEAAFRCLKNPYHRIREKNRTWAAWRELP